MHELGGESNATSSSIVPLFVYWLTFGHSAHVEANCLTDYKGDFLGFCFAHQLDRRGAPPGLVQRFMPLCSAQHKRTYVVLAVMLRSGCEGACLLGFLVLNPT